MLTFKKHTIPDLEFQKAVKNLETLNNKSDAKLANLDSELGILEKLYKIEENKLLGIKNVEEDFENLRIQVMKSNSENIVELFPKIELKAQSQ